MFKEFSLIIDPTFHMWFALLVTIVSVFFFVREKVPLEITSVIVLTVLMLFGQFFPLLDVNGNNKLNPTDLLSGFSNPSLIAVLALLVMGQAIIQTDALRVLTGVLDVGNKAHAFFAVLGMLLFILIMSAFMNNTPLVIIAIPIMQTLARSIDMKQSRIMIPISYVAILGGMMTLIGSSTNLLVSSSMLELGYKPLEFFDFLVPGAMLAAVGFVYVVFVAPLLLSDRSSMAEELRGTEKEFVAELDIATDSPLVGMECVEGEFPELKGVNIKLIQRGGHLILPPFEGYEIKAGDIMIVSATRETLVNMLGKYPGFLLSEEQSRIMAMQEEEKEGITSEVKTEARLLAEIMITPASRLLDMSLDHANFQRQFGAIVLGIQRRARVVRRRLGRIRLEAGDVLLVAGKRSQINAMRDNADFIMLSGSKRELPFASKGPVAGAIFLMTIGLAAIGVLSIPVAAITGSVLMLATGCLNIRQATRAIDRKIFLLVGSMLALGVALQASGAASFLAESILTLPYMDEPVVMLGTLFLLVALATNILTNNACAILFTPIALNLAGSLEVPPDLQFDIAMIFAITVIFGANCSFASPIGYQTNLLVMGPGHYRFVDFIKAGVPLILLLWATFMLIVKFYYGL